MRGLLFLCLFSFFGWRSSYGEVRPNPEYAGIGIEQVGVLSFPITMQQEGILAGEVRATITVSAEGTLTDLLITAYTKEAFANAAFAALKRWRYLPARVRGSPVTARSEVTFSFRSDGVVVQSFPSAFTRRVLAGHGDDLFEYRSWQLRDLDAIPVPISIVAPTDMPRPKEDQSVTVDFYIDEKGAVRMPAVSREHSQSVYAAAAVAAVEQWRFEPPRRRGRPALVLAEQVFNFRANP